MFILNVLMTAVLPAAIIGFKILFFEILKACEPALVFSFYFASP